MAYLLGIVAFVQLVVIFALVRALLKSGETSNTSQKSYAELYEQANQIERDLDTVKSQIEDARHTIDDLVYDGARVADERDVLAREVESLRAALRAVEPPSQRLGRLGAAS